MRQAGLFGLSEHLERLSRDADPLEVLEAVVDFEHFCGWLVEGFGYGDGSKGGCPPFDPVSMFKALMMQASYRRGKCVTAMPRSRRSVPSLSTSSSIRRTGSGSSFVPSVWPAPRQS